MAGLSNHAQITTENAMTPAQYVQDVLVGGGVQISNVTYNGQPSPGPNQAALGSFTSTSTLLPLANGLVMASGGVLGIPTGGPWSTGSGLSGDADLLLLSGQSSINDCSILEFDFIPTGDSISFNFVFASSEYASFTCTGFNDSFGFFLSGPGINGPFSNNAKNIALIPNTTVPITINTVNGGAPTGSGTAAQCAAQDPNWQANSVYYVNNPTSQDFMFNGLTVPLTAWSLVTCGQTYHIKLAIGDALDTALDSGVFLEGGSFSSTGQVQPSLVAGVGVQGNTMMEGCGPIEFIFTRLGDLSLEATVDLEVVGTATAGNDYTIVFPTQLYYAANQETVNFTFDVPVDADGPETIIFNITQLITCANTSLLTTFTFNIDSPPPLTVDSYDVNSICGQVNLLDPQVSGGVGQYEYLWSTGETTPTINVSPAVTTTYDLTVSDGCQVLDETVDYTVTLPVYAPLDMTMTPDVAIDCLGSDDIGVTAGPSGGDGDYTYAWSLNGGTVGTPTPTITVDAQNPAVYFVLTITDGCGSVHQDSVLVSTVPLDPIVIETTPDLTVICPGDTTFMQILSVTGGNGVYTYEWANNAGQIVSTTTSHEVSVIADQVYTITVEDQCDYIGNTTITTLLPVYDQFLFSLPSDMILCAGDTVDLQANVSGGSGYYYLDWVGLGHTDPVLTVSPMSDTEYEVIATDQCGEQRTDRVIVQVEHVSVDIVETIRGQDDWYLQAATTPYAATWIWDMGDGTVYRGPEVVHSYMNLEEHWVHLKITTPNGCEGMDSLLLRSPAHVYFPNAFSPDGDGHNDQFNAIGHYIEEFEMEIFDRWGHRVFYTDKFEQSWDGSVNGSGSPQTGVYVYKYRIVGHYFPAMEGYGHVTLLAGSTDY
jgi:gliding motility-associated-like protein